MGPTGAQGLPGAMGIPGERGLMVGGGLDFRYSSCDHQKLLWYWVIRKSNVRFRSTELVLDSSDCRVVTHLDNHVRAGSSIPRRSQCTKLYHWYWSVPGYILGCSARIVTCE